MKWYLKTLQVSVGFLSLACFVPAGHAQDMPKEGKFSITFVLSNHNPSKPVPLGLANHEISIGHVTAVTVNDAGRGFMHNMAGRCSSVTDHDLASKTFQRHGLCHFLDQSTGDQVFSELGTTPGKGKWIGGTGRFTGLSGDFDIQLNPVFASESLILASGKLVGTYQIK